ncbi:MAG TPA: hypothetical protein VFL76_11655 [Edaphocola sp.]|nr:hypothetical protein [Edaphocola sp.]
MSNHFQTQKNSLPRSWAIICLLNLLLTALVGLAMRYKIVFPLPVMDQANALHAHANFVFSGWVGLTLFSSMVAFVLPEHRAERGIYRFAFYFIEITALAMLTSFLAEGYGLVSISLAILSALAGILFVALIWKDLSHADTPSAVKLFLRGAMLWYLLSVPGTLLLIYFNISGKGSPIEIRAAFYFFLHFQYNGWFTFGIFGLLLSWLHTIHRSWHTNMVRIIFWLLTIGLVPGYFLSILAFYPHSWAEIPSIISVITSFIAAVMLFIVMIRLYPKIRARIPWVPSLLWQIATLSFFLKTIMQAATLIPSLAAFAFSFRPLVIGFLHLTFLCFITFFLIGYLLYFRQLRIKNNRVAGGGLLLFVACVLLSEAALFAHSLFAFIGIYKAFFTKLTFWITVGIFLGLLLFVTGQLFHVKRRIPGPGRN